MKVVIEIEVDDAKAREAMTPWFDKGEEVQPVAELARDLIEEGSLADLLDWPRLELVGGGTLRVTVDGAEVRAGV